MEKNDFAGVRVEFVVNSPFKVLTFFVQSIVILYILLNSFLNALVNICK